MMRLVTIFLLSFAAGVPVGCGNAGQIDAGPSNTVRADGLAVTVEIPSRQFAVGDSFDVVVTAVNTTNRPIRIVAGSGAPVYVSILRYTGLYWQEVKRYPRAATMVMNPWTLRRRSSRRFVMPLTVEPDWPTGEILSIMAELNGRPDAAPRLTFEVVQPETPHTD